MVVYLFYSFTHGIAVKNRHLYAGEKVDLLDFVRTVQWMFTRVHTYRTVKVFSKIVIILKLFIVYYIVIVK